MFDKLSDLSWFRPKREFLSLSQNETWSRKFWLRFRSRRDEPSSDRPCTLPSYLPRWLQDRFKVLSWLSDYFYVGKALLSMIKL